MTFHSRYININDTNLNNSYLNEIKHSMNLSKMSSNFNDMEQNIRNELKYEQENHIHRKLSEIQSTIEAQKQIRTKLESDLDNINRSHNKDLEHLKTKCENEYIYELNRKDGLVMDLNRL